MTQSVLMYYGNRHATAAHAQRLGELHDMGQLSQVAMDAIKAAVPHARFAHRDANGFVSEGVRSCKDMKGRIKNWQIVRLNDHACVAGIEESSGLFIRTSWIVSITAGDGTGKLVLETRNSLYELEG